MLLDLISLFWGVFVEICDDLKKQNLESIFKNKVLFACHRDLF